MLNTKKYMDSFSDEELNLIHSFIEKGEFSIV
jgi:hypothetical protein